MPIKKAPYPPVPDWAKSGPSKDTQHGWDWIVLRDTKRCIYCLKDLSVSLDVFLSATLDHLIPRAAGGSDCLENLVTCCAVCNRLKGHITPEVGHWKKKRNYIRACRQLINAERRERTAQYRTFIGSRRPDEVFNALQHSDYL